MRFLCGYCVCFEFDLDVAYRQVIGMYEQFNPNPKAARVGDCTVRAISKALGWTWEKTYIKLCAMGLEMADMPNANAVWGAFLKRQGFERYIVPNNCPNCYTVRQFADDHQSGTYVLALSGHVVCCMNGCYYDSFDSGDENLIYYWTRGESDE